MKRYAIALISALFPICLATAQAPQSQQANANVPAVPVIRTTTSEVTLDMIFHDKRGKPIRDIRPDEVHVFEDGVEQKVNSFRFLSADASGAAAPGTPTPSGSVPMDPMKELRFVTLVFENLDLDGKRFFRQALQDILSAAPEQNLYYSVLVVDQRLNMVQSFTNDHEALLKAVDKSTMWNFTQYLNNSNEIKSQLRTTLSQSGSQDPAMAPVLAAGSQSGPSQSSINGSVGWRMAKMQYDMLEAADAANRDAGARSSLDALLALVKAESQLPGRKVVLYFNPWLTINDTVKEQYNFMISAANRANVTFYTVDPKGLVTWSQEGSGRDQLRGAAGETRGLAMSGGVGEVSTGQSRAQENAENGIASNPLMWLRDLAQKTGGVSIGETNDVKAPLRAVMDDVKSYYEASYDPHIATFDGKFHAISVKVSRPGVDVSTRSGYFALPAGQGQPSAQPQLAAYEVPLMKAISAAAPAGDIPFTIAAERFNERGPKVEYMLTLEAALKELTFAPQADHKTALVDAPVLAVVRDASGEIAAKFSKEFAVTVPADKVDAYKQGQLVQTFHTELAPGNYTLETAIMDRKANKLGVQKTPLTVPEASGKLTISDVVVVRRKDDLKSNEISDPFFFQGGKVTPTLDTTLKGGKGSVLPFYFAIYPDQTIKDAPTLTMAFYKEGQYLGSSPVQLGPVQKDGRIPYIAVLPGDPFVPGSYEIKLDATQGSATAETKLDFKVN